MDFVLKTIEANKTSKKNNANKLKRTKTKVKAYLDYLLKNKKCVKCTARQFKYLENLGLRVILTTLNLKIEHVLLPNNPTPGLSPKTPTFGILDLDNHQNPYLLVIQHVLLPRQS